MIANSRKIKNEESFEGIIFSVLIGVVTFAIIAFLIVSNVRIGQKRGELSEKINSLQKEIQAMEEKKAKLEAGISETQDASYWEEKVREQGYKKSGEEQVVVLPPQTGSQPTSTKPKNFFERFLSKIGF